MTEWVCPKCGNDGNGYETRSIQSLTLLYGNDHQVDDNIMNHMRGGSVFYCSDCGRDVTQSVNAARTTLEKSE